MSIGYFLSDFKTGIITVINSINKTIDKALKTIKYGIFNLILLKSLISNIFKVTIVLIAYLANIIELINPIIEPTENNIEI